MNTVQNHLKRLNACKEAVEWAEYHDCPRDAWYACPRSDWLLWLALKLGVEQRLVVFAACGCARLALPFTLDERRRTAILMAELWANGDEATSIEDFRIVRADAREAALDAGCFADFEAANAAYAAFYAASAALPGDAAKDSAAASAESAVEAAAEAAGWAVEAASVRAALRLACANVVSSHIAEEIVMALWYEIVRETGA